MAKETSITSETIQQVCRLLGYDPIDVVSIHMEAREVVVYTVHRRERDGQVVAHGIPVTHRIER